ncbi:anti-sigma factor family protein [Nonomuraea sp. NPDC050556]|uniref:anti-sigma factor family protein n=1 Tax=Nonomuraea sp. NPDC050556 TaxID=3364369 RepID=UPI0037A8B925
MNSRIEHTDVGAYALGLLDDEDRAAFETHLAGCAACTAELGELSGMAGMLTGIEPVEVADPPPMREDEVIDLFRRKKAADKRTRRGTFVIGVAAAATLLTFGITIGTAIGNGNAPAQVVAGSHAGHDAGPAEQFYEDGAPVAGVGVEGVTGGLVYESKGWGTHAALKLSGVKGPLECELIAVSKSGQRRVMTGWAVPPSGYGVPGQPAPLYMHGGSPLNPDQIDKFEVTTSTGKTLLTVDI